MNLYDDGRNVERKLGTLFQVSKPSSDIPPGISLKPDSAYFLTPAAVEWVDAFMRREHKQILCDSLNYCIDVKGLEIFAYVIMSSHMHMIARAKEGNLSDIVRDFKKFMSAMLIKDFRSIHT